MNQLAALTTIDAEPAHEAHGGMPAPARSRAPLSAAPQTEAPRAALSPLQMLQYAVEKGADLPVIEKLTAIYDRWEAHQARRAFDEAIAAAKAEIPVITKNRTVAFASRGGGDGTSYRHEDLGEIARIVTPILGKHGLSYRFRTSNADETAVIVTCIISHRDGHFEENTLRSAPDKSGSKNGHQAVGSAITYLQRYTLKAALGLAAAHDDDGRSAAPGDVKPTITIDQLKQLREALSFRDIPEERACKRYKVERLEDVYAVDFDACLRIAQSGRAA